MESALVMVLDDAEPFDAVRRDFAVDTVTLGIPFHVTLLYPFAPQEQLSADLLAELRSSFAARSPFEFELTRVAAWPDVELRALMHALFARFPQWPPYGGIHDEVVPHATLGEEIDAVSLRDEVERRMVSLLPRRCQARDVTLLEEYEPKRWRERDRFPLGG